MFGFVAGSWEVLKDAQWVLKAGLAAGNQAVAPLTCMALVRSGDSRFNTRAGLTLKSSAKLRIFP